MDTHDLSDELIAKARACKSMNELCELAREQDTELTFDDLEAVAGGSDMCYYYKCDAYDSNSCWTHCPTVEDGCECVY